MRESQPGSLTRNWKLLITLAAVLVLCVKFYLALKTNGSLDVPGFEDWRDKVQQFGVLGTYHQVGKFNNPFNHTPFIAHLLNTIDFFTAITHLPFKFWLRIPAILADLGSLLLVAKIFGASNLKIEPMALMLLAICPISIFVSGFHGQVDPVMVFFLLLSLYIIEKRQSSWLAGIAFGISMSTKVVPIIFAPVIFLYLRQMRDRLQFFISAGLCFVGASSPYILQEPITMLKAMFGYGSIYGAWGWTRILVWTSRSQPYVNGNIYHLTTEHLVIAKVGRDLLLSAICVASFLLSRLNNRPPIFVQCGIVAFLFMFLTPGYGIQYQSWLVPWTVALGLRPLIFHYAVAGIYLFAEYLCWARWDSFPAICAPYKLWILGLVCWCGIFIVLMFYLRALKKPGKSSYSFVT